MKRTAVLLFFIIFFAASTNVYAAAPPHVTADGAVLVDMNSGQILYERNKDKVFYPASTTKIMTALLVLERCKLDDKVIIGENPSSFIDGSKIYIFLNEELTVDQLLHALLIQSANDVALALAEHVAGSQEAFADLMNRKAEELGCKNTHFVNPHGLYDKNHYTTAYDLSLIAREAMKNQIFRQIVSTPSYTIEPTNKQKERRYLHINNYILLDGRFHVDGADGVKVGYTSEAGHSFVGSASRGDSKFMVVLLHDKKPGLWEDASGLLNYAFKNYKSEKELTEGQIVTTLRDKSSRTELPLTAENDFYATVPLNGSQKVESKIVITNHNTNNIISGENMGYIEYSIDGNIIGEVNLRSSKDTFPALSYSYEQKSTETLYDKINFLFILSAAALITVSAFVYIALKRRKRKNKEMWPFQ